MKLQTIPLADLKPWSPSISLEMRERFNRVLGGVPCAWCGAEGGSSAVSGADPWLRFVGWCGRCDTAKDWRIGT